MDINRVLSFSLVCGIGLRASGNLPVSYVLTGNLPVTYRKFVILFIFLSFRSIQVAIPALNRATRPLSLIHI